MHIPPSHFATAPVDTGKGFTKPLRSLRALFWGIIYNSIPNLRLCQRSRWRSWRPGWRK